MSKLNDYSGDDGSIPVFDVVGGAEGQGVRVMENAFHISLDRISAKKQVREDFDQNHIGELALSLKEHGLINPIEVRDIEGGYEIVAGECRYRAAKLAGWTEIACVVTNADNLLLRQITENTHRKELSALEEARGYRQAMDELGLNGQDLAAKLGVSANKVNRSVRLLKLPEDILTLVAEGKLSKTFLVEVQKVKDETKQRELIEDYLQSGGSHTHAAEKVSKKKAGQAPARGVKKTATIDEISFTASCRKKKSLAELAAAARQFADQLEEKVRGRAA